MPDILTITDVAGRYGIERHKASQIMRKLPNFRVGNKLFVYTADLEEWERSQMVYPVQMARRTNGKFRIPRRRA